MKEKSLIFLSAHDPTNILNWSGTLYSLYQALKEAHIKLYSVSGGRLDYLARQVNRVLHFVGLKFDCRYSVFYSLCAGIVVSAHLMLLPKGPILAVAASNYAPHLITRRRIIYITDGTFRANARIYSNLEELPGWLYRQFDDNESRTLHRAKAIVVPSKWAADSAKLDYGVAAERIIELPFGANIPSELINEYYSPKSIVGSQINLLFVSANWKRKGGDKAIEVCRALIERGINAQLIIIGEAPTEIEQLDFVEAKGFLKKSDQAQLACICRAYQEAHFLLLPTSADASPIVFSECRAFGVPPITHMVGGIPSAINHRKTGLLLPLDAPPDRFAAELIPYILEPRLYEELSRECRKWYVEKAQWSNWCELIIRLACSG
jgi:glycosyltransferase involved in cell wall biosynthesis